MKVNFITQSPIFKGVREDRNTTEQLKQNNDYSLTEPNQRRINKAIENLAKQRGEENIKFLLDVGEHLTYQTNIDNGKKTKNEWRSKLRNATKESLAHSNPILREKYLPEIQRVFDDKKALSIDEKAILMHKRSIMKRVDSKALSDNPNENIRALERNMDYFITSTETPTKQKRYVMQKLDFFMSPNYKINPQLENKKTQVLAEIINDIAIDTPESKVPNMKAVNQKTHGMCAAISIARKAVAYEDKPNYVDNLLSELNDKPIMEVYDRQNLGSGEKVPVKKTFVDFDYAQEKGYRIIDASTLQWMNIAGMYGAHNENLQDFNAFDKNNLDAFHDSFFLQDMHDESLKDKQHYYQVLSKAKETLGEVKSDKIKKSLIEKENSREYNKNLDMLSRLNDSVKKDVKSVIPDIDKDSRMRVVSDLQRLYQPTSESIKKLPEELQEYAFIPNEESSQKEKKVKQYFIDKFSDKVDRKSLEDKNSTFVENIEMAHTIGSSLRNSEPLSKHIANARKLYEAESVYRASVILGLMEKDNLTDNLIKNNIPDRETRILNGYDEVINRIEKKDDKKMMSHFAQILQVEPDDKESILEGLKSIRDNIEYLTTVGFDELYGQMGYTDRNNLILGEIKSSREEVAKGNKAELNRAATCLHVKEDKKTVLKEYDKLEQNILNNPKDLKVYREAFNRMGYKDQVDAFVDIFNNFAQIIADDSNPEAELYRSIYKESSGLPETATKEEVLTQLNGLADNFNSLSQNLAMCADFLEIKNEDGSKYFTVDGKSILLKKYENEGRLVPEKDMRALQDRFTKIDKIRSTDEFSSRQGKISNPELYKMSKPEKEAIKNIDKKLNSMYSDVTRELNHQYREIKKPLEKHIKYIGTNSGKYWVSREGSSGLYGDQQVKIFEQMTDRPYYEVTDLEKAVDMIKNGTHSGNSSSSVFHDRMGGHAQYIVDIREDGPNGKDILYHDNTWGASEHENTWVDSEGLTRTDYSDRRGGELGYITDNKWTNGNYVENLTHKKGHVSAESVESKVYKKLNPGAGSEFDFELMSGVILPGNNPEHKDIAGSLKDTLFIPETAYIDDIQKLASGMTKEQIQKAIFRNETAAKGYNDKFEKIMKRVNGNFIDSGVKTLEDYNKLSDNDAIKIAFEKSAIREAYPDASMYKELGNARTMKEVDKIREKQYNIAKSNFNYSFGKDSRVLLYEAYEHAEDMGNIILTAMKDNHLTVDEKICGKIMHNVLVYGNDEKSEFNGSLKDTIKFVVDKTLKQFDENVPHSEDADKAKEEIKSGLSDLLKKDLYFDKSDLKLDTDKAKGIRKWIDDKFNPVSDEEFVEVYRNLQDMKTEDFEKLTQDLSNQDLGIANLSGFDMLTKVRAANDAAESSLRNVLFFDEYSKDLNMSKTKPAYKYGKLELKTRGATYVGKRTFDDLYRSMNFSLSTLDYERMFNKHKDESYRLYGAIPAYPSIDFGNSRILNDKMQTTNDIVHQVVASVNTLKDGIASIKLVHDLDKYRQEIPQGRKLTPTERKTINLMVGDFITINYDDSDFELSNNAAMAITELDKNATIDEYNKHIDTMLFQINALEKVQSVDEAKDTIKANISSMKGYFNTILNIDIPPKYHRILKEDIKDWMNEELKYGYSSGAFSDNRKLVKIKEQIEKYGSDTSAKDKTNDFTKLVDSVTKTKQLKDAKKQNPEKIQLSLDKVNALTDKYIDKHIKPEYQDRVKANMSDWISQELVGGNRQGYNAEKCELAREKFENDFRKYHMTKQTSEILKNFLLLSASDAEPNKNKDTYKHYLEESLKMAQLVEVQDTLIEAVRTGNAAQVKDYFDDYSVEPYSDGNVVSMNSDEAIDYMVRSLIVEDNTKTAKMFIEKLGLGDRYMKVEQEFLKEMKPQETIDTIADILRDTNKFANIVKPEISKFVQNIDTSEDFIKDIDIMKNNIITQLQAKELQNKDYIDICLKSLDELKQYLEENPNIPKSSVSSQMLTEMLEEVGNKTNENIKTYQSQLDAINLIYQFIGGVNLPEYTKGYKIQQDIIKSYNDLMAYNNKVMSEAAGENSDIEIMTKNV